ncbi:MAG: hypothetical protein U9R34_06855 [Nanoarchaeota archaeon]|nr:hypothetical protein [Nanoarchaeota archaeon]
MSYSSNCNPCSSLYGKDRGISDLTIPSVSYGSSNQQSAHAGSSGIPYSLIGLSSPGIKSPPYNLQNSRSIDDLLPYQKMRPPPQINNGFYQKPEARFYAPGQSGDFGEADHTRVQKGYGVNSQIEGQYGVKK